MRILLLVLLGFYSISAFAQTATVLGIPEGTYTGSDVLVSQTALVPTVDYTTVRILRNGTITAHTKAYLLGHEIGNASARLKVKVTSPSTFVLLDLDRPGAVGGYAEAGSGSCSLNTCSFSATVMGGALKLYETWARGGPNELFIRDGWQSLNGITGTYTGRLTRY